MVFSLPDFFVLHGVSTGKSFHYLVTPTEVRIVTKNSGSCSRFSLCHRAISFKNIFTPIVRPRENYCDGALDLNLMAFDGAIHDFDALNL